MKHPIRKIPEQNILDLRSTKSAFDASSNPSTVKYSRKPLRTQRNDIPEISFLDQAPDTTAPIGLPERDRIRLRTTWKLPKFSIRDSFQTIAVFILLLLFVVAGISTVNIFHRVKISEGKILGASTSAFDYLDTAQQLLLSNDRTTARNTLLLAHESFSTALEEIASAYDSFGILVTISGKRSELDAGEKALRAGRSIAQAGLLVDDFLKTADIDGTKGGYVGFIDAYEQYGHAIRKELDTAHGLLQDIQIRDIPETYRLRMEQAKKQFNSLYEGLRRTDELLAIFSDVLGFNGDRSHLLLFQNNQELRATGGFIGSVAHISVSHGTIKGLYVPKGGSYDISGQVQAIVKAPKPLQIVNPYFSFQDANWFADFEISAKKILSMYEEAGNEPVDGIIAFTPDIVVRLLGLTGPITLSETVSVEVTQDNFLRVLRDAIEKEKLDTSSEPKKVIAELLPSLLNKALNLPFADQLSFALVLDEALSAKDVLLYATDPVLQEQIVASGFEGNLQDPRIADDYFALISSNIAGGKTDRDIMQHITIHSVVSDIDVVNTITIKRTHQGIVYDPYSGVVNLSYDRFYTPPGSVFIGAEGFYDVPATLYQEPPNLTPLDADLVDEEVRTVVQEATGTRILDTQGKTIFGNWIRVGPGQTAEAILAYSHDKAVSDSWSMYFERQPGARTTYITWIVDANKTITETRSSDSQFTRIEGTHAEFSFELTRDVLAGVVF